MELPIEKQFQIMDALRWRFFEREISQLNNVPKSTVQNYKKLGSPYFRRLKKILSIEQYPSSLQEENEFLKKNSVVYPYNHEFKMYNHQKCS